MILLLIAQLGEKTYKRKIKNKKDKLKTIKALIKLEKKYPLMKFAFTEEEKEEIIEKSIT